MQNCNNRRKKSHILQLFRTLVFLAFASNQLAAQEPYTLADCVSAALAVSPELRAAETDLRVAEALADQAEAVRFLPKFDLTWIVGPSPEARGDAVTGETDIWDLNVFNRAELTFVQPIYTFGRLEAALRAARAGIVARTAGQDATRQKLIAQVAQAYYGLVLANHLWDLATEARGEIGKARDRIKQKLEDEEGDYTYTDLFKLDRFVFDIEENANKVEKGRALLSSSLRRLMGLPADAPLTLEDEVLKPVGSAVETLPSYLERARERADVRQLEAGVEVLGARAQAARAELYPQVFLAGQFSHGYAPNRDNQTSPFARDDFNFLRAGAVIGLKQSLSFGRTSAKARQHSFEHKKLTHQRDLAYMGASLEIERAYRDLKEAESNVQSARKARRATRRWFLAARDGFNAGLEDAGELIEAVKEYGIIRGKYFEAVFKFNKAWIALSRASGRPIVAQ